MSGAPLFSITLLICRTKNWPHPSSCSSDRPSDGQTVRPSVRPSVWPSVPRSVAASPTVRSVGPSVRPCSPPSTWTSSSCLYIYKRHGQARLMSVHTLFYQRFWSDIFDFNNVGLRQFSSPLLQICVCVMGSLLILQLNCRRRCCCCRCCCSDNVATIKLYS